MTIEDVRNVLKQMGFPNVDIDVQWNGTSYDYSYDISLDVVQTKTLLKKCPTRQDFAYLLGKANANAVKGAFGDSVASVSGNHIFISGSFNVVKLLLTYVF